MTIGGGFQLENFRIAVKTSSEPLQAPSVETQRLFENFELEDDEVLVEIYLRPIHPADVASLTLLYPGFQPSTYPAVPGLEGDIFLIKSSGSLALYACLLLFPFARVGAVGGPHGNP